VITSRRPWAFRRRLMRPGGSISRKPDDRRRAGHACLTPPTLWAGTSTQTASGWAWRSMTTARTISSIAKERQAIRAARAEPRHGWLTQQRASPRRQRVLKIRQPPVALCGGDARSWVYSQGAEAIDRIGMSTISGAFTCGSSPG
jgi:hypothetical protein